MRLLISLFSYPFSDTALVLRPSSPVPPTASLLFCLSELLQRPKASLRLPKRQTSRSKRHPDFGKRLTALFPRSRADRITFPAVEMLPQLRSRRYARYRIQMPCHPCRPNMTGKPSEQRTVSLLSSLKKEDFPQTRSAKLPRKDVCCRREMRVLPDCICRLIGSASSQRRRCRHEKPRLSDQTGQTRQKRPRKRMRKRVRAQINSGEPEFPRSGHLCA